MHMRVENMSGKFRIGLHCTALHWHIYYLFGLLYSRIVVSLYFLGNFLHFSLHCTGIFVCRLHEDAVNFASNNSG